MSFVSVALEQLGCFRSFELKCNSATNIFDVENDRPEIAAAPGLDEQVDPGRWL
jgi:hypothetical protein